MTGKEKKKKKKNKKTPPPVDKRLYGVILNSITSDNKEDKKKD